MAYSEEVTPKQKREMLKMIKHDEQFFKKTTERLGRHIGELYAKWHNENSTELSYKWLAENNYAIEVVLEQKYQDDLQFYLIEQFIEWYRAMFKED